MQFSELPLVPQLLKAVADEGYSTPTPIQAQSIPHVVEGRDLLGIAQTGTGKTAAFSLPLLQRLMKQIPAGRRPIRALILSPTRELAAQIGDSLATYGRHTGLTHTVIFGGVGQNAQEQALRRGIDIVVATPGRFLDLMQQGFVKLDRLEVFVLDEADRMLDMGFVHDVKRVIAKLPKVRQSLFFSATMPPEISQLAGQILTDPVQVEVTPAATTAEKVDQRVYFVERADKRRLLVHLLTENPSLSRVIVFTRTKHGANKVAELLDRNGIEAAAIHGNKSQSARERALGRFRDGTLRVLVATDIAARGIDVEAISHVVNFDLPNVAEQYVHRIGRTARAGASGQALSFCEEEERPYLVDIERLTKQRIPVEENHPWPSPLGTPPPTDLEPRRGGRPHSSRPAPRPRPQSREGGPAAASSRPQTPRRNRPSGPAGGPRPQGEGRRPGGPRGGGRRGGPRR